MTPETFTVRSAALRLGCSPETVYKLIRAGHLIALRIGPKMLRIKRSELERYESACQTSGASGDIEGTSQPLPDEATRDGELSSMRLRAKTQRALSAN